MNGNPGATKAASADIVDTAFGAGALTTLTALTAAGLTETLKGPGPLTVFAPTNEAFGLLPSGAIDNLLQDPFGQLTETLKYHVVPGEVMAADLVNGQALIRERFSLDRVLHRHLEVLTEMAASQGR